jgi:ABC-type bacteriocin/lantibiotic exporter with double-glycine peptidase domain
MPSAFPALVLPVAHLEQPHPGDCLAACAVMSLTFSGMRCNYERFLKVLQIRRPYGAPFPNLHRLERLGISVLYRQGTVDDLYRHLSSHQPVIVPVKTGELPHWSENTDHAVVVVGMDEHSVYLNDPAFATAPIQVPHGDFDLAWLEREEYYAVLAP